MRKKKVTILFSTLLFSCLLAGCSPKDTIFNFLEIEEYSDLIPPTNEKLAKLMEDAKKQNEDKKDNNSKKDNGLNTQTQTNVEEISNTFEGEKFVLTINNDKLEKAFKDATFTYYFDDIDETTKTKIRVNFFLVENKLSQDFPQYREYETININGKEFLKCNGAQDTYYLLYKENNMAYIKIQINVIGTYKLDDMSVIDSKPIDNIYNNEEFIKTIDFDFKVKDGVVIEEEKEAKTIVEIEPETKSEVNFADKEKQYIYTLLYSDEIATNVMEKLNECGIYKVSSATLDTSEGEYLVNVVAGGKHYYVHVNMEKEVSGIQKDNLNGEYIYKTKIVYE